MPFQTPLACQVDGVGKVIIPENSLHRSLLLLVVLDGAGVVFHFAVHTGDRQVGIEKAGIYLHGIFQQFDASFEVVFLGFGKGLFRTGRQLSCLL